MITSLLDGGLCLPADDLRDILVRGDDCWNELRGSRVFITGGTGFIGRWLVEALLSAADSLALGCKVCLLTRDPARFRRAAPHLANHPAMALLGGDVRTLPSLPWAPDLIIHAAADSLARTDPTAALELFRTIVDGTSAVLTLAAQSGTRKGLLISSGAIYGSPCVASDGFSEDFPGGPDPLDCGSAYGEGKRAAELLAALHAGASGLEVKIARCFTFIGPLLPLNGPYAAGNFLRDALAGSSIRVTGDGTAVRSYLYAGDLIVWLLRILCHGRSGRAYNVGSSQPVSIRDFAERISTNVVGSGPVVVATAHTPGLAPSRYVPSTRRAEEELKLSAWTPLDTAIRKTVSWWRGQLGRDQ